MLENGFLGSALVISRHEVVDLWVEGKFFLYDFVVSLPELVEFDGFVAMLVEKAVYHVGDMLFFV